VPPGPEIAVVVATHRRASFLGDLVSALEDQDLGRDRFEVVVVDDASGDETWPTLERLVQASPLRLDAVRLERNAGPAGARHAGVARTSAPLLAFTDDDCLPRPGWLAGLVAAFAADPTVDVVQGRTEADPRVRHRQRPWDHTLWVTGPTPWFETCNVAYRRSAYDRVGGFDLDDPVLNPGGGSHFGEDVDLGARVLASGGRRAFAEDAVVDHRVLPGTWRSWLAARRRLADFPALARRSAVVRDATWHGVFLDRSTAAFDLAAVGVVAAAAGRRAWPLVLALPWARSRWREARRWAGSDPVAAAGVGARLAAGDAVALAALVRGSVRHRRLLL
jgi:glycosyltransferase involved in cell wall biosynthesis